MAETKSSGFTKEERAAMKQRAAELKKEASLADVLQVIADMPEPDRGLATKIHEIVTRVAPDLVPSTWYGFPAYKRDGKVVVFYQQAAKFGTRYGTLGFQEDARLDDGAMWPTSFAVTRIGKAEESRIAELVQRANG